MGRIQKTTNRLGKAADEIRNGPSPKTSNKRPVSRNTAIAVEPPALDRAKISRESVNSHALATFGSPEKAQHWMNRPNPLFDGKSPAKVIEFNLVGVEAELVRIDHGVYV